MPVNRLLMDDTLTPEQRHVISLAFDRTLAKLHLVDRNDPICEKVAHTIIEIGKSGSSSAIAISELALRRLRPE